MVEGNYGVPGMLGPNLPNVLHSKSAGLKPLRSGVRVSSWDTGPEDSRVQLGQSSRCSWCTWEALSHFCDKSPNIDHLLVKLNSVGLSWMYFRMHRAVFNP